MNKFHKHDNKDDSANQIYGFVIFPSCLWYVIMENSKLESILAISSYVFYLNNEIYVSAWSPSLEIVEKEMLD